MNKPFKTILAAAIALILVGSAAQAPAADKDKPMAESTAAGKTMDIYRTIAAKESFDTLVKALQTAGLVETLEGKGPFTLFAPTDEAFAKLPPGTLDALLADNAALTKVLRYHLVDGKLHAAELAQKKEVTTVQGGKAAIAAAGGVTIDGAKLVKTDIVCTNGVIHVIDVVMMP
ncbi:MAG TPA: fasciclin domain-containing protein [Candidatus Krumholzibacteria bacterium]|nr:fasciclin domain-containing protein [Candidatus Krumholzibacteria bacterium]HPD70378.1 fasciclin domain-containing protein [Candidatus Krumholzibacteria bacterium]HRY39922.1 fasciclin domain-containing protein [Candidatus Krumholzibacteria bacterium]